MNKYVLDASAVLTLLNQETGKERVASILSESVINTVNYCEVLGKLIDAGLPENDARESIELLSIEVVPFNADAAYRAAVLRPVTKKLGLSLGDRSCLALGLTRRGSIVVTAEKIWTNLNIGVKIELIR